MSEVARMSGDQSRQFLRRIFTRKPKLIGKLTSASLV
jgi:hypothetical protein